MTEALQQQKSTLLDIEQELVSLFDTIVLCHENNEQPSEELLVLVQEWVNTSLQKRDRCAQFIRHVEYQQETIQAEIGRLIAKKSRIAKAQEGFERYCINVLDSIGKTKLEGEIYALAIRKNPPKVEITDEKAIPIQYLRLPAPPPPQPDKTEIKKALLAGKEVPGAELIHGRRLEVK